MRNLETKRLPFLALAGMAVLLLGQSCGNGGEASGGLRVERAEVGLMPGEGPAVAYVTVSNGGEGDRLVAVETPLAAQAELHESLDEDGVVKMVARPEGFEVPAGGILTLEPGGKHIMLFEPRRDLVADGHVALTLQFEHGGTREVQATVLQVGGGGHEGMDHGAMDHPPTDHGSMDHSQMDHSQMDHAQMDHGAMDHGESESPESESAAQDEAKEVPGA